MDKERCGAAGKLARAVSSGMLAAATCAFAAAPRQACAQVAENILFNFKAPDNVDRIEAFFPPLVVDAGGKNGAARALYGVTPADGSDNCNYGCGTLFKLTPPTQGQTYWTNFPLWNFTGGSDGSAPRSALLPGNKHVTRTTPFYGTTSAGNGTVYSVVGNTLTTIYTFTGGADGANPGTSNVVADASGALYVALQEGGGTLGAGTIDKLTPPSQGQTAWTETTIWTFPKFLFNNGALPTGLVMDKAGALYGATQYGAGQTYYGNVFKLTPPENGGTTWQEQTLYTFPSAVYDGNSGIYLYSNLTIGKDGTLYGTNFGSGALGGSAGLVYEVKPPQGKKGWSGQPIWYFTGGADGAGPVDSVLVDRNGAVYGTTFFGGGSGEGGTVYKLTPPAKGQSAWTETTLWTFSYDNEGLGVEPEGLVADNAGTLYGIFSYGGPLGYGAVYSLTGTGFAP
jgi:hypothetical protein